MENEINLNELSGITEENDESISISDLNKVTYDLDGTYDEDLEDIINSLGIMTTNTKPSNNGDILENQESGNTENVEDTSIKIDVDVNEPNIILPRSEIIRALRYASVMIKKVTHITYKDEGKVEYRLKDNMTWVTIKGTCSVSNNNPLLKTLSFNTSYLAKLLMASASDLLIYEGDAVDSKGEDKKVLYARLINGDFILDVFESDEAKLIPAGNKTTLLKTIPAKVANTLCNVMSPLIADTQEVQSKRTVMYEDRAFFKSITYLLQFKNEFTNMCLGKKELDLLKIMSAVNEDINIYRTDSNGENRIVIENSNVSISTSVSIPARDEVTLARLRELEDAKYITVNASDFKRVLFLSGIGTNTVAKVTMNYSVENEGIDAKILGKDGNSSFLIPGDNYNNLEPRDEDVLIYTAQLQKLLKPFEGGSKFEVAFLNSGVAFRDETLGIEAIMNYARG